ncbi:MAG: hypothetical protein IJC39_01570 [Firmicutes bacterium]|nr:hypothetical protein [Bacillota bacterium]
MSIKKYVGYIRKIEKGYNKAQKTAGLICMALPMVEMLIDNMPMIEKMMSKMSKSKSGSR